MRLLHSIGNLYVRLRMSRRDLFTVDIGDALRQGGRALVFLPTDTAHVSASFELLAEFNRWFDSVHVVWIGGNETPPDTFDSPLQVISVPNAVNRWGLPARPVIKRIQRTTAHVAIDLNPTFFLPTAFLSVMSGAQLRIGFRSPRRGFFNLEYLWDENTEHDLADHYGRFRDMLVKLRSARPLKVGSP